MDTSALGLGAGFAAASANGASAASFTGSTPTGQFTINAGGDVLDSAGLKVGAYATNTVTFTDNTLGTVVFDKDATTAGTGSFSITNGVDVSSQATASSSITAIDAAINTVSGQRADLGAVQNRCSTP